MFSQQPHRPDQYTLQNHDISDLEALVLDESGRPRVLSHAAYQGFDQHDIALLCAKHGFYCLPTEELVAYLKQEIGDRNALEIGAGNGVLAQALGIRATDNHCQALPDVSAYYAAIGNAPVSYGANVEKLDALVAVQHYKPEIVIGAWFTHKYDAERPELGGNMYGADERDILKRVSKYILVGNWNVHRNKPLMSKKSRLRVEQPEWLVSRSMYTDLNAVFVWQGNRGYR